MSAYLKPPKGGTRTAADAAGVGRREAFGVRQLAAAFLCAKTCLSPYRVISKTLSRTSRFSWLKPIELSAAFSQIRSVA